MTTEIKEKRTRKGLTTGIILIILGLVWLLRKMDFNIPGWIFDWEMILIYIGVFVGISKGFDKPAPWVLIGIGGLFLIDEIFFLPYDINEYFWPIVLIAIGIIIVFKKKKSVEFRDESGNYTGSIHNAEGMEFDRSQRIDSVSIFNGIKKLVLSKNFMGGETVTVFGGTEINLLQADFTRPIELESVVIFGGLKLIVPRNWEVRTNVTSILAGVTDKRISAIEVIPDEKVLLLTGVVIFGGIDIVSY